MPGAPIRVLVTRPEPGATATARKLRSMGFEPVKLPLQEIRPLPWRGTLPGGIAGVAITSANAIRGAPLALISALARLPCFTVGEATAATAREAGFADIRHGDGDAVRLARSLIQSHPDGAIVYLTGRVRLPDFEKTLTEGGFAPVAVETYDTVAVDRPAERLTKAVAGKSLDYALIYSANAGTSLAEAIDTPEMKALFDKTTLVCISPRVAEHFGSRRRGKILVAGEPTETSLLSLLSGPAKGHAKNPP